MSLNQDEFAALGGVKRRAQSTYETDERVPDAAYLAAIAAAGADVGYILTGVRKIEDVPAACYAVDQRAKALIDNYMECGEEDKRIIERMVLLLADPKPQEVKAKKRRTA